MITVPCGTLEICRDCEGDPRVPQMKRSHGFEKLPQKVGVSMEWNRAWGFWRLGLRDWGGSALAGFGTSGRLREDLGFQRAAVR